MWEIVCWWMYSCQVANVILSARRRVLVLVQEVDAPPYSR